MAGLVYNVPVVQQPAQKKKKGFFAKLFKSKPGGTFVGNLIRGVANTSLGLNLQPPIPLAQDATLNAANIGGNNSEIKDILNEALGGLKEGLKAPKKVNQTMDILKFVLIGFAVLFGLKMIVGKK